jgi:hypothetical protein
MVEVLSTAGDLRAAATLCRRRLDEAGLDLIIAGRAARPYVAIMTGLAAARHVVDRGPTAEVNSPAPVSLSGGAARGQYQAGDVSRR